MGKGHIVPDAIGKIDGIGFFVGNHIYLLIYYKSTICISPAKVCRFSGPAKETLLKSVKGFEKSYSPRRQAPSRHRVPLKAVMEPAAVPPQAILRDYY